MMKNDSKIGILTFFLENNYGAVLQAFSLQKKIEEFGSRSEFISWIDYSRQQKNVRKKHNLYIKILKTFGFNFYGFLKARNAAKCVDGLFSAFRKKYLCVSRCNCYDVDDLASLVSQYSGFVAGSDMVWTDIGQNLDVFFLQFAPYDKRGSYAPSLTGTPFLSDEKRNALKNYIEGIKYLSFREKEGQKFANAECHIEAPVVIDPTLLHTKREWCDLLGLSLNRPKKKYVLCYLFGEISKKHYKNILLFAKENDMDLRFVPMRLIEFEKELKNGGNGAYGPKEFVEMFFNASFVFTNSYHGFLFSLIANVPFVVFRREKDNAWKANEERISSLLIDLDEQHRFRNIDDKFEIDLLSIDYKRINYILSNKREHSMIYLKNMINAFSLNKHYYEQNNLLLSNISSLSKKECVGCLSCVHVCPKQAISESEDEEGFLYPHVDDAKCISCSKCTRVCPVVNMPTTRFPMKSFMSFSFSIEAKKSASGGVFYEIAKAFITKYNGYVFGVAMDERTKKVSYISVNSLIDLPKLQGSKYVKADTGSIYYDVKKCLSKGFYVLFSGTPCVVGGLINMVGINNKKLYTIDLICHGVPSQKLWLNQVDSLECGKNLRLFSFRNKDEEETRRSAFEAKYMLGSKTVKKQFYEIPYYRSFINNLTFMKSCYYCKFADSSRVGDITIGDCDSWKLQPTFFPNKAKSTLLINTEKGFILKNLCDGLCFHDLNYLLECECNTTLKHPSLMPKDRNVIYYTVFEDGWKRYSITKNFCFYLKKFKGAIWKK